MKDIFLIKGLGGKKTLKGFLPVYGAKNEALPAFASSLLFRDEVVYENVPRIADIEQMSELIKNLGGEVEMKSGRVFAIGSKKINKFELDQEIAKHMRASIVLTGPVLARFGKVSFPHPGGCVLGERPVDIFLEAFRKMGAKVEISGETYTISVDNKKLRGAEIFLRLPSHTVTETIMMAAVLAEGITVIKNSAMEPEIKSLADFLNSCGAKIKGAGTSVIEITGGAMLEARGKKYQIIPDRIEAGSFLILAALAGEEIIVDNCNPVHLESVIDALRRSGVDVTTTKNSIIVKNISGSKNSTFVGTNIRTHEYPGFPTDLQAPMAVFLSQVTGESAIFETIFEGRLSYVPDLEKMGAKMNVWGAHTMTVKGPATLKGRELYGPDIRAGLAYVLAAVVSKGRSVINNVHYIDRGYERIEERLRKVGVDVERVSN